MIEVEKKCLATPQFLDCLQHNAIHLGERVLEDIYFNFEDLKLVQNDIWLRQRNGKYELKIPMSDHIKSDVYEEIEDETQILKRLNIKNFDNLMNLATLISHRQKFHIDNFHIDIDEITSPGIDFHYNIMEVELMIESTEQYEEAQDKILKFMNGHGLKNEVMNGKIFEFFRLQRRDVFDLLKVNPHFAHCIIEKL
jgi:adenylate cyclase class IV